MKKLLLLLCLVTAALPPLMALPPAPFHLMIAPGTLTHESATLIWDKQYRDVSVVYEVWVNGEKNGTTTRTNFSLKELQPLKNYMVEIRVKGKNTLSKKEKKHNRIRFKTYPLAQRINVLDYGAKGDGQTKNTKAIQAAIDACPKGGTVLVPEGVFLSGALFLKSDMTLWVEKGAVLKGTTAPEDYLPMIRNRFEGWEMDTYASLLNAGTLNRNGTYNISNLRIGGEGTVSGGGRKLGDAMIKASGIRSRGRLICLMNCRNVSISGITVTEPPAWTIHYIYSDDVTCHNLNIITNGIRNGDGIDPDSSTDSYIFNCTFNTGDDCIAIKSGKNPEGFYVAKPTKNVRITDCDFVRGHGISIGSEMSGGVSDVLVQDCKAGALLHGMQIKGTKDRGGYVKNVTVADCQLMKITIFSAVNYNNDGAPAPQIPVFEHFVFRNIDLTGAVVKEPVININGFSDSAHKLKHVTFNGIRLPENAKVLVKDAEDVQFTHTTSAAGNKPVYTITDSKNIRY